MVAFDTGGLQFKSRYPQFLNNGSIPIPVFTIGTVNKIWQWLTGFELWISGVGCDSSTNCATSTAPGYQQFLEHFIGKMSNEEKETRSIWMWVVKWLILNALTQRQELKSLFVPKWLYHWQNIIACSIVYAKERNFLYHLAYVCSRRFFPRIKSSIERETFFIIFVLLRRRSQSFVLLSLPSFSLSLSHSLTQSIYV